MLRHVMNAVAHLSVRIGNVLRVQSLIDRFPRCSAVISAKRPRGGDRDKDPVGIVLIQDHGVQTHAAGAWLPLRSGAVTTQARKFLPRLAAIRRTKQGGIFNAGIDIIRIGERRLKMPYTFELPRMRSAVI